MGVADVVRRVVIRGGVNEDVKRIEVIVLVGDGMVWIGCINGLFV